MDVKRGIRKNQSVENGVFQNGLEQELDDLKLLQLFGNLRGEVELVKIADIVHINEGGSAAQLRLKGGLPPVVPDMVAQKLAKGGDGFGQGVLILPGGIAGKYIERVVDKMRIDLILQGL